MQEMNGFQPPAPLLESLAYATTSEVWVAVPAACLVPASIGPLTGLQPCSIHLLGRKQGRLIFDLDLMLCPSLEVKTMHMHIASLSIAFRPVASPLEVMLSACAKFHRRVRQAW